MDARTAELKILMFPWLAHGHIFPFLELSKRILARKNFHIHLCTTPINFPSITNFIQTHNLDDSIDLMELHLQPCPELPPHYHTTKNLPPHLNPTLHKAFQTAKFSFPDILATLKPDLVIYDLFQPWAPKLASSLGIPAVHYSPLGAATPSYWHHHYICWDDSFPFPELRLQADEKKTADDFYKFVCANVFEGSADVFSVNIKLSSDCVLLKTSRGVEGKYVDYLSRVYNKKFLPVGPLVTDPCGEEDSDILQWLSKKPHQSTVYIAFGSEYFPSKDEGRK